MDLKLVVQCCEPKRGRQLSTCMDGKVLKNLLEGRMTEMAQGWQKGVECLAGGCGACIHFSNRGFKGVRMRRNRKLEGGTRMRDTGGGHLWRKE